MPTIQEIIAQTDEAIAQEFDFQNQRDISSLAWLKFQIIGWKRLYLKKNQQQNYFRITKIIPAGMEEFPAGWPCKFQIWVNGTLTMEFNIEPSTFDFFETQPGWEKTEDGRMTKLRLNPTMR